MGEGEELWKKYCSFFDKPFSEQVEYNELKLKEYFKRWKQTKIAKKLCPKGVKKFDDVPLTTYEDYPILHEFGKKVEKLEKTVPRRKGELFWDYYGRIGKQAATILDGWLPDDYSFCIRSGGTTGRSKWIPYGASTKQMFLFDSVRPVILSCSENWGKTSIKPGDNILNVVAPIPYITGYVWKFLESEFSVIPPFEITDNIKNMRKKISAILKTLENKKVYWLGGVASFIKLLYDYFMNPQELYREYYRGTDLGLKKFILYLIWLKSRISGKKYENIREILPLKGIMIGGMGTHTYIDFIKSSYGLEPLTLYGSTEGISMTGFPLRKMGLHPVLDWRYFEFLDKNNEIKKVNGLKKDDVYEVIGTVFNSILIRYCVGDLLKVVDIRDDGMPIFEFESRKSTVLDVHGWFRLTEAIAEKALSRAGLKLSDNWAISKEVEPREHLLVLMEKDWGYSEEKASKKLFGILRELDPHFNNYVEDFKIKESSEVIEVKYLKKGVFRKYSQEMVKEGKPLTHYKPPRLITPEKHDVVKILMEM